MARPASLWCLVFFHSFEYVVLPNRVCRCITRVWGWPNWINGCSHGQRISVIHPDLCVSEVRSRALHILWYEGGDPRLMTCCQGITRHNDWARQYGRVPHLVCWAFTIVSCQTRWEGWLYWSAMWGGHFAKLNGHLRDHYPGSVSYSHYKRMWFFACKNWSSRL